MKGLLIRRGIWCQRRGMEMMETGIATGSGTGAMRGMRGKCGKQR